MNGRVILQLRSTAMFGEDKMVYGCEKFQAQVSCSINVGTDYSKLMIQIPLTTHTHMHT